MAGCLTWNRKSQIAIEYAYRLRKASPKKWIFWVYAGSSARFEQSYRAIAAAIKLPGVDDPKTDILGLVCRWLESDDSGEWLMILDNADDASVFFSQRGADVHQMGDQMQHTTALSAYLPQTSMGSILITSRNRDAAFRLVGREDRIVKVERMGEADCKALLLKKLPNDQSAEDKWNGLVTALECLPLAITQAAAYIAVNTPIMTISKYLGYFHRNEKDQVSLLSKAGGDLRRDPEVPNAVVITWQISFDQIKKQNARAADLLSRMCLLDRQGIPRFLFCQDDDGDALDFEDAIGTLIAFSFVEAENDGNIFQMHPLVQLSTKKWLEVHGEIEKSKEHVLSLLSEKLPNGEHANWKICEALDPHTGTVLGYHYTPRRCRLERAKILHNSAWYAWARGNYGTAGDRIQKAIDAREELLGRDDLDTLGSFSFLALLLNDQGRRKEAEKLEVQVMETRKRVHGQEHPDTLASMANLASTYWNQGRWKEAEELQVQVMETFKRVLGQEHPSTLTSMGNLASTYRDQGRWKEAEELGVQVMETRKRVLGQKHPNTLKSIGNLASTYWNQGRLKEAEELEVHVMETFKRVLGQEHPDTLTGMANLASTYRNQGRWKEAEELQVQAMETFKRVLGQEHPSTLTSMANLASTYRNQRRWKEAEELQVQVIETRKRVLGQEHPSTLTSMANLAHTWKLQGRGKEAIGLMKEVERLRKDILGSDHPLSMSSTQTLHEWQIPL